MSTVIAASAVSMDAVAETLQVELDRIATSHPLIKGADAGINAAGAGVDLATAGYYPSVTLSGTVGFDDINNTTTRSSSITDDTSSLWNRSADLTVTQNLFNGFTTTHTLRGQELAKEVSEDNRELVKQIVLLEGVTAYLNVLRGSLLVAEAMSNVTNFSEQFEAEKRREEQGAGLSVDRITAEQRLLVAQGQLLQLEGLFREAEANYEQVFGHRPELTGMTMPPSQRARIPESLEAAIEVGLRENPAVGVLGKTVASLGAGKRAAEGAYYPSIDLTATYLLEDDVDGTIGMKREKSVAVTATWTLFNGFATRSQVAQASFQQAQIREQKTDTERRIREAVERFWHQFTSAHNRAQVLVSAVAAAEDMVEMRQIQLDEGDGRRLDVLDAQSAVHAVKIELGNAQVDALIAEFGLLNAMGRLTMEQILFETVE